MTERIGKYEIIRRVGSGGFGAVYEARDPMIQRSVAIKTCQVQDETIRARFAQEAQLAGNLHHRNLTTVHDFGTDGEILYLVCEFLPGEDLDSAIERGKPLSLREKVEILIGIASGLAHAHNAGVVHRDVKPSNIRLLPDGTVKIMDFGVAKSMYAERQLTRTGFTVGTHAYLAPEQVRGQPVDRRTDIFAFGVLAYELLCSHRPFSGASQAKMLEAIASREPEPLAAAAPGTPPALARLVERAMRKNPADRYPAMEPVGRELMAIRDELAAAGRTASPSDSLPLEDVTLKRPSAAPMTRPKSRVWIIAVAFVLTLAVACALLFWLVPRLTR
ncbi:MAG: serine/threonine-protein kinase [Thermoanaerobaculia bacterium]